MNKKNDCIDIFLHCAVNNLVLMFIIMTMVVVMMMLMMVEVLVVMVTITVTVLMEVVGQIQNKIDLREVL